MSSVSSGQCVTTSAPPHHDGDALGLSESEAAARLRRDGYNELASARPRGLGRIVLDVLFEPMLALLLACGAIYLTLGNPREALMLLVFVFVVIGISFAQRRRTERSLDALRNLSSPRALVIRRGPPRRIPGREVVVGDCVVVAEGDRIPADGILIEQRNLAVDESLLTGESVSVRKTATDRTAALPPPGGDGQPFVYAGTLAVRGKGLFRVTAIGADTAMGRIGRALAGIDSQETPMQREVGAVVRKVAVLGLALSLLIALGYGLPRDRLLDGLLLGITFAMAILPEELPVIMTLFLGAGAWRLARQQVLTRRVATIETLGTTTVLCVDKTGTLTHNRMQVAQLCVDGQVQVIDTSGGTPLPETFHGLLEFGVLACQRTPFDPMERAIHDAVAATLAETEHVHADWTLVNEYPLSPELLAMSRVWQSDRRAQYAIAAKGAPEAVVDLCHLDAERAAAVTAQADAMAAQGLRVLGVARAAFARQALPAIQHAFDFEFLGLIGLADPVRAEVPAAIRECHAAGIRVVMITGDYPPTAATIAAQIGIDLAAGLVTGSELEQLDHNTLAQRVREANIFCRVSPEQKLQLVEALKANGEIVAMTGDGVNDAPAIRAAHIGIAMGARGTDVAREAADLVLMNDAFDAIVAAVRMGRRTYDNLTRAIGFALAVHVPILGLSLLPLLGGWPLILLPVHILFLQLLIDPACSIVFEAAPMDADLMRRPPRSRNVRLFRADILWRGLLQGALLLAVLVGVHTAIGLAGGSTDTARAVTYAAMMLANLGLILSNLSPAPLLTRRPTRTFIVAAAATVIALALILLAPPLREVFFFARLSPALLAAAVGAAALATLAFEIVKWLPAVSGGDASSRP